MLYAFGGHSDTLQVVIFLMISMTIFGTSIIVRKFLTKIPRRDPLAKI
jgi:hypothetical protein